MNKFKQIRKEMNIIESLNLRKKNLNEISHDLRDKAIQTMKNRNMDKRADKWTQFYIDRDLSEFKGKEIFYNEFIILGFRLKNNILEINYGSPPQKEYNKSYGTTNYHIDDDKFYLDFEIDRKTARIFSQIATIINNQSKYNNGIGDFKIKGW